MILSLLMGTPKNAQARWHFCPLVGPRKGRDDVATSDFVFFDGDPRERRVQFQVQEGNGEEAQCVKEVSTTDVPCIPVHIEYPTPLAARASKLDPKTIGVGDWIVEKQSARYAQKTKAEKGEKVQRIIIHVDKQAEEGRGHATTTGDEGGDKYCTQQCPTCEADEDWRPECRKSDELDASDMDSSRTTNSGSGATSSSSSECSSESSS